MAMKYDIKKLKKKLNEPTGFTVEWMDGGIDFRPPAWTWYVLYGVLCAYALWFRV
jgi:hypothetical protein